MFKIPLLVIIFNRPDFTEKIFKVLRQIEPEKLYVISDGPGNLEHEKDILQSREIFNAIDWDCEVKYNYSDTNLGLRKRISSGISWAFENEDRLIILEDDCIPHPDFFPYCEELLAKYQDDNRIMCINGCNLNPKISSNYSSSYFFTKYSSSWGWATWKRAWELYDGDLSGLNHQSASKDFAYNLPYRYRSATYWRLKLNEVKSSKINSWSYRWMFTIWVNNGLAIVPKTNLIQNIGNDNRSTNTKGSLHYLNIRTSTLNLNNSIEPKFTIADTRYDKWLEDTIYSKSAFIRFIWVIKKILMII